MCQKLTTTCQRMRACQELETSTYKQRKMSVLVFGMYPLTAFSYT